MKIEKVMTKNATYQMFEVLKGNRNKRYKYQEFLVEGVRNINEAIRKGWEIKSFLYTNEKKLSDWAKGVIKSTPTTINYELSEGLLRELSGKEDTSEILAIIGMRTDDLNSLTFSKNPILA